jgi:regulator of protease activity HflC (stomatin/prohibitin superfamily)
VGLITGSVYVLYYVDDYHAFLYNHEEPRRTLEALSYRELTRYAANSDYLELLGHKQREAVEHLKAAIQRAADDEAHGRLGVKIVDVALQGLHPPVEVAGAFEEVVGAMEEREAKIWAAKGYANSVVPRAERDAVKAVAQAEQYAADRKYVAPAAEEEFKKQLAAYRLAPSVFKHRKLLSALKETLLDARKIIKPPWVKVQEVIQLNLEEKMPAGVGLSSDVGGAGGPTP